MKRTFCLMLVGLLAAVCCGCRNESAAGVSSAAASRQASSRAASQASSAAVSREEASSRPVSPEASSAAPSSQEPVGGELAAWSNEKISWGQDLPRNEKNQPRRCLTFQEKYGRFDALFLNGGSGVALTFDEGYANDTTAAILDTLREKGVKATFFITYEFARTCPALVRRMIDEGHTVGNHSWTHPSLPTKSIEEAEAEITRLHDYVKENFGYEMSLFRPPYGEFSERTLEMTRRLGYRSVFWSFAYLDYDLSNQPEPQQARERILDAAHEGAIYLLHAASPTNAAVLGDVIDGLREKGLSFVTPG